MADTGLIVIASESRREICLRCRNRHDFTIAGDDGDDVFLCKKRYRSSCTMKAALRDRNATCPSEDVETAILWNMARLDDSPGCELQDAAPPSADEQVRIRQAEAAALERSRPVRITPRGGGSTVFKVYE